MTVPACAVVIPTYKRPAALRRTLSALVLQPEARDVEVVVVDDGSPPPDGDAVATTVEQFREQHGLEVRVVHQENAGPAAARNTGARSTGAPLLVFLDDDCAPAPGFLARHLEARAPGERIARMGHVAWSPDLRVTPFMELVVRGAQFNYGAIADPERVPFTCFYTANCSLWRDDLDRAGWFDASLPPFMEDTEFAYRFVGSGGRIVYHPAALVHHEHAVELESYLERQRKAGKAAVEVVRRHPELFDVVGVADVADVALREQFYNALLRYAFVLGVEEGLAEDVDAGRLTGGELRGRFEGWVAGWAVHREMETRAWRTRTEALGREVTGRDRQLAEVIQAKDDRIASLEAQLGRLNSLAPLRLYHALAQRVRRAGRASR